MCGLRFIIGTTKSWSRAGKEILLKSVAQAIPNFVMSMILLPLGLCHDIERMLNGFWWGSKLCSGKGITWMRWDHLYAPKSFGGIGFRRIHEFNLAFLCKQGWKLMMEPTSLVARLLKARYYPQSSFLHSSLGHSIWATKNILSKYSKLGVGDGSHILVFKNPWLHVEDNGMITKSLGERYNSVTIKELMMPGEQKWDKDLVSDLFNSRDRELILSIPFGVRKANDNWYWMVDDKGLYSIKSGYKIQQFRYEDGKVEIWTQL